MVLDVKDADRLETIRKYIATDPVHFKIDNRPVDDCEQRDKDLDRIFTPARGFRVRQEYPASDSVEVEGGVHVSGTTITEEPLQTFGPIPAAGGGNIRIDLIWWNLTTSAVVRTAGPEQAVGVGFPALTRPDIPGGSSGVPLANLYVDDNPTSFEESIAIDTAGCIQDIRPAPGFSNVPAFETVAGNILSDTVGGSAGSSAKIVRADHRHNLLVDATLPADVSFSAALAGVADVYARRDHVHKLPASLTKAVQVSFTSVNAFNGTISLPTSGVGTWLLVVFGRYHQDIWGSVSLTINGTVVDTTGAFGDQSGTGYVTVFGALSITFGGGAVPFAMTNINPFMGGGPYMCAIGMKTS